MTFTNYFAHPEPAPLLEIHGRTFPVEDNYLEDIIKDVKYRPAGNARPSEKQTEEQLKSFRAEYESIGLRSNDIQTLDTVSRSEKVDAVLTAAVVQYAIGKADDGGGVLVFCPGTSNKESPETSPTLTFPLLRSLDRCPGDHADDTGAQSAPIRACQHPASP